MDRGESKLRPGPRGVLFAMAVILGPGLLFWHLHGLWSPDGDYAYGWAVPPLALFLWKFRWDDRPEPSPPLHGAVFFAVFFALLTLPARWLQEAAPERSICAWSYAVGAVGVSLSLIALAGGGAWLRWLGFPVAFALTAVPWPHAMESLISNFLMRGTARITVEILCLTGVPSAQAGNLVHIENGVIDIDEACSGIRSLQAMVMIALFLGELFRLKPARRWLLVAIGLTVTLGANVLRTVALSSIGFRHGMGAVDRYHDAAGAAVLILSLSSTLGAAFLLRPAKGLAPVRKSSRSGVAIPAGLSLAVLLWFLIEEVSVEGWYRLHEPKWQGWSWAVQWPRDRAAFHFIEIPERSRRLLMCDESQAARWNEPDGGEWSGYWIRWNPGNPEAEEAKVHRPDVCLNAEGAVMERDMGTQLNALGGMEIPFHRYTFRLGEKRVYVFFCLYEEGGPAGGPDPRFEGIDMVQRALEGRRHIAEQSLELALSGYRSEAGAQEAFEARLGDMIRVRRSGVLGAGE